METVGGTHRPHLWDNSQDAFYIDREDVAFIKLRDSAGRKPFLFKASPKQPTGWTLNATAGWALILEQGQILTLETLLFCRRVFAWRWSMSIEEHHLSSYTFGKSHLRICKAPLSIPLKLTDLTPVTKGAECLQALVSQCFLRCTPLFKGVKVNSLN